MQLQMEFWEDYETLRIETPEGLDLYLPLAGFGPRFLALLVDTAIITVGQVILGVVGIFVFIGAAVNTQSPEPPTAFIIAFLLFLLLLMLLPLGYFSVFESIWAGQSPGKRLAGIRVIRRGGFPIGLREIVWRNVLRIVDYMPSNYFAGLVSFFATSNQQRLGDLVADTVVVREFTGRRPGASPFADGTQLSAAGAQLDIPAGSLTPQSAYAIRSYLQRAPELELEARESLSLRCITALGYSGNHLDLAQREGYLASVLQPGEALR